MPVCEYAASPNPCNFTDAEKALRGLIMIGTMGQQDLSDVKLLFGVDQVLFVSSPSAFDVAEIENPKGDVAVWLSDIVRYAGKARIRIEDKVAEISPAHDGFEVIVSDGHSVNTGTSASFSVPSGDIQDMAVAVKAISAMVLAVTGNAINDMVGEDDEVCLLEVGSGQWQSPDAGDVPLTVFVSRTANFSHTKLGTLDLLTATSGNMVGVFDGKWYHPGSTCRRTTSSYGGKAIWNVDPIVVSVPYSSVPGELPEVRGLAATPKAARNTNSSAPEWFQNLASAIPAVASSTISSPSELAAVANWLTEGHRDRLGALGIPRSRAKNISFSGSTVQFAMPSGLVLSMDADVLRSVGDFTVGELLGSENGTCFKVALQGAASIIKKGPYVTGDDAASKAIALGGAGNFHHGIPWYDESASKKDADAAVSHGYVPASGITYASKNTQRGVTATLDLTPVYPMGCALSRITGVASNDRWTRHDEAADEKPARLVVFADASESGIKAVRSAVGDLIAQAVDIPDSVKSSGLGILACLPPKDVDGSAWSEEELAAIEEAWLGYADMIADHAVFFSATQVADILAAGKEAKAKAKKDGNGGNSAGQVLEEVRKMLTDGTVVERRNVARGKGSRFMNGRSSIKRAVKDAPQDLIGSPSTWALVIAEDARVSMHYDVLSVMIARLAYALDAVPAEVDKIAAIAPSHWNAAREKLMAELGVTVVYDASGKVEGGKTIWTVNDVKSDSSQEAMGYPRSADRKTFPTSLEFAGEIPEKYAGAVAGIERLRVIGNLQDSLNREFQSAVVRVTRGSAGAEPGRGLSNVPLLVDAMSFGKLDAGTFPIPDDQELRDGYPKVAGDGDGGAEEWRRSVFSGVSFPAVKQMVMEEAGSADIDAQFSDVCRLWRQMLFDNAGMTFTVSAVDEKNVETFKGVGAACGLDTAVEAYMIGVSVEDLLG